MRRKCHGLAAALILAGTHLLIVPVVGVAQSPAQPRSDRLTLDDYLEWEEVLPSFMTGGVGPQVSPDGSQVLYTRRIIDKVNDRWASELRIMNADGTRDRFLTEGAGARWSPDGTRIAFVREGKPRGAQVYVRWMDAEGATTQVTRVEHSPGAIAWSPDGQTIAFTMMVPSSEGWNVEMPRRPSGAQWAPEPKVVTRLDFRRDYAGYTDLGYSHIFVVPAGGGAARQLTHGDWNHGAPVWTRDGGEILFSSLRVPEAEHIWRESEIYAVSLADGSVRQLTTRKGPDTNPVVSPDGRWVAYVGYDWTDDTYITNRLYVMGLDGSGAREISGGLDRSPSQLLWSPDNSGVYFSADDEGSTNFFFAPLQGAARRIIEGKQSLTVHSLARTGLAVATLMSATDPGNIVTFDVRRPDRMQRLTDTNAGLLAQRKLGEVEEIWYPSVDGLRIQGWIVKPPDFDARRKYPLALAIHGGPHGMYGHATPYMWFEWQWYAANGFVVLYTNPRGSSGYGSEFGNAIKNAYPGKDYDDLMAGVDTLLARGYIDRDNLFVYGCSGGGVLTAWIIGQTDRFAAASSECPVTNWLSFVGTTDGAGWYRNFAKLPWEDPSEHLRRSPLMYVGNVKTPTILITGENDLRTPMSQTEEYYQALRYLKVPTAMVRLQDEWHAYFNRPSNTIRMWSYRKSWFDRYMKTDRTTSN